MTVRGVHVGRFRTHATGALLAYLAFPPRRLHPRDALLELLWPDVDPTVGANRLSTTLSFLRPVLEPAGMARGTVLESSRTGVRLVPEAVSTDVEDFVSALHAAECADPDVRAESLRRAISHYRGPLLPEFYDTWVLPQQELLAARHREALRNLARTCDTLGDSAEAILHARSAIAADPCDEVAHQILLELLARTGEMPEARRLYRNLARRLERRGEEVGETTRALMRWLSEREPRDHGPRRPPPNRLPAAVTRFFGREEEIGQLVRRCHPTSADASPNRLVTLLGMGGAGKTRLALEVAQKLLGPYSGNVWFVGLQDLRDPAQMGNAILSALQVPRSPRKEALEQVADFLEMQTPRPCLLVLDNLEQLGAGGADVVRRLLRSVHGLTVLATSRTPMDIEGERRFPVPPLPLSFRDEDWERTAAVRIFVDRVQMLRPDFALTRDNAASVRRLCEWLEGIPLALEMAASRAQTMGVAQMVEHLDHRFTFLRMQRHEPVEHRRTLRATLEWSRNLLPEDQRRFFARLSMLRGIWSAEDASAICAEEGESGEEALEALVDAAFVVADETDDGRRFRMLDTLREFADESLPDPERATVILRHAAHFLRKLEEAQPLLVGKEQRLRMDQLEADLPNHRAALEASLDQDTRYRLCIGLFRFWSVRGYWREGLRCCVDVLGDDDDADRGPLRATVLRDAGTFAQRLGDYAAARRFQERGLALCREISDPAGEAYALRNLGNVAWLQGDLTTARRRYDAFRDAAEKIGDPAMLQSALTNAGLITYEEGDYEGARALYEAGLALAPTVGDLGMVSLIHNNLGNAYCMLGDHPRGHRHHAEALELRRQIGDVHGTAQSLANMGTDAQLRGDLETAARCWRECLPLHLRLGDQEGTAARLDDFAWLAESEGRALDAARLWGAADRLRAAIGAPRPPDRVTMHAEQAQRARAAVGETAFWEANDAGRAMDLDRAIALALSAVREPDGGSGVGPSPPVSVFQ